MKEYKAKVIEALVAEAKDARIVGLKKTAQAVGVDHLNSHEAMEVLTAAVKQCPSYRIVKIGNEKQMRSSATASLWETGCLIEDGVEFESREDYDD